VFLLTHSPITSARTDAETALLRQFSELKKAGVFADAKQGFLPSLAERERAIKTIEAHGLPTRKVESWHYTDLRRLLAQIPLFNAGTKANAAVPPLLPEAQVLRIINGKAEAEHKQIAGIHAAPLTADGKADMAFTVLPAEEKRLTGKQGGDIAADINTAFARDGWHIDVPAKSENRIIELQNIQKGGQSHSRFPVHIGAGARLTVLERQIGDNTESLLTSDIELKLAEGADVHWIILRERGVKSEELNRFQALLSKNAKLTLYIVNAGAHLLRQEVNVDLAGEGANFQLRGVNLLSETSHTDTTMAVRHLAERTDSTEIFRNVVTEAAHGVFQGIIRVAQAAQKTNARMACNSLILSDKAEFDAKPELEIFADDVACGHGATVAEINRDHLFYLMARGIPESEARALLVKAFVSELIDELPAELSESLHISVDKWLTAHFRAD